MDLYLATDLLGWKFSHGKRQCMSKPRDEDQYGGKPRI
jgi:hypothetical protein